MDVIEPAPAAQVRSEIAPCRQANLIPRRARARAWTRPPLRKTRQVRSEGTHLGQRCVNIDQVCVDKPEMPAAACRRRFEERQIPCLRKPSRGYNQQAPPRAIIGIEAQSACVSVLSPHPPPPLRPPTPTP